MPRRPQAARALALLAELAAGGHANRHIARLLQISVKAVEWHLHQSYLKLDIRGRAELDDALAG